MNMRVASVGRIVKSMYLDSRTIEFVDQPPAYRMSVRGTLIA